MIQKNNRYTIFFQKKIYRNFTDSSWSFKKLSYFCHRIWRDGGVVDRGGLENR